MDVREWVGGELTVRTAGGTVSVRGKVEQGEPTLFGRSGDIDEESIHSTSSVRTLHRRFTLPADADCDRVHSTLSRDAVLTVNIPKRVRNSYKYQYHLIVNITHGKRFKQQVINIFILLI